MSQNPLQLGHWLGYTQGIYERFPIQKLIRYMYSSYTGRTVQGRAPLGILTVLYGWKGQIKLHSSIQTGHPTGWLILYISKQSLSCTSWKIKSSDSFKRGGGGAKVVTVWTQSCKSVEQFLLLITVQIKFVSVIVLLMLLNM